MNCRHPYWGNTTLVYWQHSIFTDYRVFFSRECNHASINEKWGWAKLGLKTCPISHINIGYCDHSGSKKQGANNKTSNNMTSHNNELVCEAIKIITRIVSRILHSEVEWTTRCTLNTDKFSSFVSWVTNGGTKGTSLSKIAL